MSDNKKFKTQVKSKLAELDMSQAQLAKQLGIDRHYLNQIVTGKRQGKRLRTTIVSILKLPEEQLSEVI